MVRRVRFVGLSLLLLCEQSGERNNCILNNTVLIRNSLKSIFLCSLYNWIWVFGNLHCDSFLDFIAFMNFQL